MARPSKHRDQHEMVLRQEECHNSAPSQPLWTDPPPTSPPNYIFPWCYMSKATEFVQHIDTTRSEDSLGAWEARICMAKHSLIYRKDCMICHEWVMEGICLTSGRKKPISVTLHHSPGQLITEVAVTASLKVYIFTSLAFEDVYRSQEWSCRDWWK